MRLFSFPFAELANQKMRVALNSEPPYTWAYSL